MDLSVVIVSYNCKTVLALCLQVLKEALKNFDSEVIVVDNSSHDGTPQMLRQEFPWVDLISNQDNLGFSKANNLGIKKACSSKILILNPDTLVFESSLRTALGVFESNKNAAVVGVRMLDGLGSFLPESKRRLPSAWKSFTKLSGLWKLAPDSQFLSGYYANHVAAGGEGNVEVLSGAFFIMDKISLGEKAYFDEDYFMFGEDIDFSYQVLKAGNQNFYSGQDFIIHFKGESTDRGDPGYLKNFYGAMDLFYQKNNPGTWSAPLVKIGVSAFRFLRKRKTSTQKSLPSSFDFHFVSLKIKERFQELLKPQKGGGGDCMVLDPSRSSFREDLESSFGNYDFCAFYVSALDSFFITGGSELPGLILSERIS